jgi:cytochrome c oxidase cbb3-type subunit 3
MSEGQGLIVNLTDDYWIHGGSMKDIFKSIKYGYPEKAMQSWQSTLFSGANSTIGKFY